MGLHKELAAWNLKSAEEIGSIFDRHASRPSFLKEIVELLEEIPLQRGATWLLKHHFDLGGKPIDDSLVDKVYSWLAECDHWESKLHILQCMSNMPISAENRQNVGRILDECLASSNKFVRAWAYNGYHVLATQYPEYQDEAKKMFAAALRDEAPSVKARVRKANEKGF